jgi:hypothetical protein
MSMPSYVDEPRGWLPIPMYMLIFASLLAVVLGLVVARQGQRATTNVETPSVSAH